MSNKQLFSRFKHGDVKAFEELFNEYFPSMCLIAQKYVKDEDAAKDIAQEVFIKLWNNRAKNEDLKSIKTYLYVLVKNRSLNYLRRNKFEILQQDIKDDKGDLSFKNLIIEEETYRILQQAISTLPKQSSKIIQLNLQGLKNQEVAERLGISVNTVKTLKYNSLKALKVILKEYYFLLLLLLGES